MIKATIAEAFEGDINEKDHYLYVYRDKDVIFYVGRSYSPLTRLKEHLGEARPWMSDRVGNVIIENLPLSLNWQMEMYTIEDCTPFIQPVILPFYQSNMHNRLEQQEIIKDAEIALIIHFKPHLNRIDNINTRPLPDKYNKNEITNKNVKLD